MTEFEVDITFTTPFKLTQAIGADMWADAERFAAVGDRTYRLEAVASSAYAASALAAVEARIARVLDRSGISKYETIAVSARRVSSGGDLSPAEERAWNTMA